jgi:hypothetical protein
LVDRDVEDVVGGEWAVVSGELMFDGEAVITKDV